MTIAHTRGKERKTPHSELKVFFYPLALQPFMWSNILGPFENTFVFFVDCISGLEDSQPEKY